MKRERYRFWRQVNGKGAYGDVEIRLIAVGAGTRRVVVGENVDAAVSDEDREAATYGVNFALDNAEPLVEACVEIECIRAEILVDLTPDAIAYAAAQATWRALQTRPTRALKVNGIEIIA